MVRRSMKRFPPRFLRPRSRAGVPPAADGTLALTVGAAEPAKFVVIGASYDPIHEGDALSPVRP